MADQGTKNKKAPLNPWLLIFITTPIPLLILGLLFYKYSTARTDFHRLTKQMVERQNKVLANDAVGIAGEVSHLLESAARDVQTLALIQPTAENYLKFYLSRVSQVVQMDARDDSIASIPLPLYNELTHLSLQGDEILRLRNGKKETNRRRGQCLESALCDKNSLDQIVKSEVGKVLFGSLMRWYAPEGTDADDVSAGFSVYYRAPSGIYVVSIDYRFWRNLLTLPTFPYERKRDLLHSYQNGNYIYVVDSDNNMLIHPKYWHVTGIEREAGKRTEPMRTDQEEGKKPLNVAYYQGERLREYFQRLIKRSFLQKTVDIFQASNLGGVKRILSVAPILLSKGQFQQSGQFGYVILGCNVDYFEEPKEQYVPYY